jgi:hypothetical protein
MVCVAHSRLPTDPFQQPMLDTLHTQTARSDFFSIMPQNKFFQWGSISLRKHHDCIHQWQSTPLTFLFSFVCIHVVHTQIRVIEIRSAVLTKQLECRTVQFLSEVWRKSSSPMQSIEICCNYKANQSTTYKVRNCIMRIGWHDVPTTVIGMNFLPFNPAMSRTPDGPR